MNVTGPQDSKMATVHQMTIKLITKTETIPGCKIYTGLIGFRVSSNFLMDLVLKTTEI